jgi:hypothetical protein
MRVVPALDEVEDGHPSLGLCREAAAVQELALKRGKEALTEGVVRGPFRRLTPCTPTARMRRATRLRPMGTPSAANSACTRGTP